MWRIGLWIENDVISSGDFNYEESDTVAIGIIVSRWRHFSARQHLQGERIYIWYIWYDIERLSSDDVIKRENFSLRGQKY